MQSEILFPSRCALIPEEEMTYPSGSFYGYEPEDIIAIIGSIIIPYTGACLVSDIMLIMGCILGGDAPSWRKDYEKQYGISAYTPDGYETSDFKNYKERMVAQGRDSRQAVRDFFGGALTIPFFILHIPHVLVFGTLGAIASIGS